MFLLIPLKLLQEVGLFFGLIGTFFLALPAFKSKLRNLPEFNEDKLSVNSTRSGLIFIGFGFLLQLVAILDQP
jgi:uncharacterized protein YneF (UPF0154 family)